MKNVYWDGHERIDVVKRRKEFLQELQELDRLSTQYTEDLKTKEWTITVPTLGEGDKEHVLIWHDEMAVHANDCRKAYWGHPSETVLRDKNQGRLMMVSDFITAGTECGRLVLTDEQWATQLELPEDERSSCNARRIIYPSSAPGGDAYWNMKQMVDQLRDAIRIANIIFPGKTLVFIFDNSSAHNSLPVDALSVNRMNVGPGGKNVPNMHDTVIPLDNPAGFGGRVQTMQFLGHLPDNDRDKAHEGKPKGIAKILEERGLVKRISPRVNRNRNGEKVIAQCKACEEEKSRATVRLRRETELGDAEDEDEGSDMDSEPELDHVDCCMTRMLSQQADFRQQKTMLEQVLTEAGHKCIFLPKFHCELNPIEYYWGWVKREFRDSCTGKFAESQRLLTVMLDKCPVIVIRRFIRRAFRYVSVYRLGATGPLADFAVKKYRSHRTVSQRELVEADKEKKKREAKMERKGGK
jgi:hypothetical protein